MAKRRQGLDSQSAIALVFIALAYLLAYAVPVGLIAWWCYIQARRQSPEIGLAAANLSLTDAESKKVSDADSFVALGNERLEQAWFEGSDAGLAKRSDGMFDARSRLGGELNTRIEDIKRYMELAAEERGHVLEALDSRIMTWIIFKSQELALKIGGYSWLVSLLVLTITKPHWSWFNIFATSGLITAVAVGIAFWLKREGLRDSIQLAGSNVTEQAELSPGRKTTQNIQLLGSGS